MNEPKKASHQANVIRITAEMLRAHPDPETTKLELIDIGGYQVVTQKGQFKPGDLAVYIQPDSVVPQTLPFEFIWGQYSEKKEESGYGTVYSDVPERRRRITVRKFRKEWSEGLLLPVTYFTSEDFLKSVGEGTDVSDILGITHYDPDAGVEGTRGPDSHAPRRKFRYPRTANGWFNFLYRRVRSFFTGRKQDYSFDVSFSLPTYDVDALKNYKETFAPSEEVIVTEKIHGSNARFVYLEGIQYAGSRNQWKAPGSNTTWHKALDQNPHIGTWCKDHEGYALYGEITPTQDGYDYGSKDVQFFLFDIRTPEGTWLEYDQVQLINTDLFTKPQLFYAGPYAEAKILAMADGPSFAKGAKHIREGVVIKTRKERTRRGLGRAQLKVVGNVFLDKQNKR